MQMRKVHSSGTPLTLEQKRYEYVRFVKQCLRDLQPLNRAAIDVCGLIERSLHGELPTEAGSALGEEQRRLLVDVVHHLVSLLRTFGRKDGPVVNEIEQRLTCLASAVMTEALV